MSSSPSAFEAATDPTLFPDPFPTVRPDSRTVAYADNRDILNTRYIIGTVTDIPSEPIDNIEIEISGTEYDLTDVRRRYLACGGHELDFEARSAAKALKKLLPVGTKVVAVVGNYDSIYVQNPAVGGPSVNAMLLRAGFGETEDDVTPRYARTPEVLPLHRQAIAAEKRNRRAKDGFYGPCNERARAYEKWSKDESDNGISFGPRVDWGDDYCNSCHLAWRAFRRIF